MTYDPKRPSGPSRRDVLKYAGATAAVAASPRIPGFSSGAARAAEIAFDEFKVGIWSGMPNLDPEQQNIRTCLVAQKWLFDPILFRDRETNELQPYLSRTNTSSSATTLGASTCARA